MSRKNDQVTPETAKSELIDRYKRAHTLRTTAVRLVLSGSIGGLILAILLAIMISLLTQQILGNLA